MPLIDKLEYEKRIRNVQEWILEDFPTTDIINQMIGKWGISVRQAQRYLKEARKRWVSDEEVIIDHKRKLKILKLKKIGRSLKDQYKGTPEGIRALMIVEKEIIELEALHHSTKIEITGKGGEDLFKKMTDEELTAYVAKLEKAIAK